MAANSALGSRHGYQLAGGALSGKYTRSNAGQHKADRAALVEGFLNEKPLRLSTNSRSSPGARDHRRQRGAAWSLPRSR